MSVDRLSIMLNSIKNAAMAHKEVVEVMHTKECDAVAKLLKARGFLSEVKTFKLKELSYKMLNLKLAYEGMEPVVTDVKRVSKPGRRIYKGYSDLHKISAGLGLSVVSTSRGIMAAEEAKKKKLGGEVICEVR